MIGIKVNNEFLDLDDNMKFTFSMVNPVFAKEFKYDNVALKFNVPVTAPNRRILGSPDIMLSTQEVVPYENVDIYFGNWPLFKGTFSVLEANPDSKTYGCDFKTGAAALGNALQEVRLQDIDLGGFNSISNSIAPSAVLTLTQVAAIPSDVAIEINGTVFSTTWDPTDTLLDIYTRLANNINTHPSNLYVTANANSAPNLELLAAAGDPFVINLNHPVHAHTWNLISYTSTGSQNMDDMVNHMNTVANAAIGTYNYCFVPVKNPGLFTEDNTSYLGYVNMYDVQIGTFLKNTIIAKQETRNSIIPFPQLKFILDQVLAEVGYTDISAFTSSTDFLKIHIWNNRTLDQIDPADGVNWFQSGFDLKDHVPEWTGQELIKEILTTFNLAAKVDSTAKTVEFFPREDIFDTSETDWTEKTILPYIIKHNYERTGYEFSYADDSNDAFFPRGKGQIADLIVGSGKTKIKSKLTPICIQKEADTLNFEFWTTPMIDQPANTLAFDMGENAYNPRFFFFHGMQNNGSSNPYPLGTHHDRIEDPGNPQLSLFSLRWAGPFGNYEFFHENFYDLRDKAREGAFQVILDLSDIREFIFRQKYRLRTYEGEVTTIVKKLDLTLTMTGLDPVNIDVIRVNL